MAAKITPQPDWHTATNPDVLLNVVLPVWPALVAASPPVLAPAVARRLQLFACACARMVWELLPTDARSAVAIRERFADGAAAEADVRASAVRHVWGAASFQQQALNAVTADPREAARSAAKALATRAAGRVPLRGVGEAVWHAVWGAAFAAARAHQAELVRDIFPPPGYVPHLAPELRTDTALGLARQMDASGDFSPVPILADALQDAGCADEVLLGRCRAPSGVHARGNWVVDLVLGRA